MTGVEQLVTYEASDDAYSDECDAQDASVSIAGPPFVSDSLRTVAIFPKGLPVLTGRGAQGAQTLGARGDPIPPGQRGSGETR